jgi:hypothetical protein
VISAYSDLIQAALPRLAAADFSAQNLLCCSAQNKHPLMVAKDRI